MKLTLFGCLLAAVLVPLTAQAADPSTGLAPVHTWRTTDAARYLDSRQTWWMQWPKAQRDHATACISCHTAVPYAMARPSLRESLGEHEVSAPEATMLGYVRKRVELWDKVEPFYNDEEVGPNKTIESRGTEAVMNALILARYERPAGKMSDTTRSAFDHMWAAQLTAGTDRGSWNWLNFQNAPWESNESHYYGATLAAIAVGLAPEEYRNSAAIHANLDALAAYLTGHYEAQPLVNRIVVLWAANRLPSLLPADKRTALLQAIASSQRTDGGWSLSVLGPWKRNDGTPLDLRSDGYATGLTVYALKQSGLSADQPEMRQAIAWLERNQDPKQGLWPGYSLNKQRDPDSDIGRFMSDAATSYSVMALETVSH